MIFGRSLTSEIVSFTVFGLDFKNLLLSFISQIITFLNCDWNSCSIISFNVRSVSSRICVPNNNVKDAVFIL